MREHLLRFVPLASHIHRVLEEREEHWAPHLRFKAELEDHLTRQEAERTLGAVIGWARYAELFGYDARPRRFTSTRLAFCRSDTSGGAAGGRRNALHTPWDADSAAGRSAVQISEMIPRERS